MKMKTISKIALGIFVIYEAIGWDAIVSAAKASQPQGGIYATSRRQREAVLRQQMEEIERQRVAARIEYEQERKRLRDEEQEYNRRRLETRLAVQRRDAEEEYRQAIGRQRMALGASGTDPNVDIYAQRSIENEYMRRLRDIELQYGA